uniref:Potassium two pore domain channel subfamily K member 16 n=1 Tax=Taeniopygia guttata TaxID=59729 RepID=H0ZBI2_TAEGU
MCLLTMHSWQITWTPLLVLGYLFYLLLGAMVFQLLEKQQFVQIRGKAWGKGVNPEGNSTNLSNWDFSNYFFFAETVVTTVGYDNLSPSTVAGQIFSVFYALFGVPLNLAFLNQLGKALNAHLLTLERWMQKPGRAQVVQTLAVAIFLTTGTLLFLVFPPLVFSFYFTFITLSTIGFGDYVVGMNPNKHYISMYRSLTAIWIVFGLAWLALVFNVGTDLMERYLQLKWHKSDLSLAEGDTTKLEDEPEQPRIHIPS